MTICSPGAFGLRQCGKVWYVFNAWLLRRYALHETRTFWKLLRSVVCHQTSDASAPQQSCLVSLFSPKHHIRSQKRGGNRGWMRMVTYRICLMLFTVNVSVHFSESMCLNIRQIEIQIDKLDLILLQLIQISQISYEFPLISRNISLRPKPLELSEPLGRRHGTPGLSCGAREIAAGMRPVAKARLS